MTPEEQAAADAAKATADAAAAKATADAAKAAADAEAKARADADAKKTYDHEYVERLRRQAADAEAKAKAASEKTAAYEKAQADAEAKAAAEKGEFKALYEQEKAKRETDLAAARTRLLEAELKARAAHAGLVDPADALALIDRSKVSISEAGEVSISDDVFTALKASKPYLFKADTTTTTTNQSKGGNPAPGTSASGADVKVDAFKLSKEDFAAAWANAGKRH